MSVVNSLASRSALGLAHAPIDSLGLITPEVCERYRRDGVVHLPRALDPEWLPGDRQSTPPTPGLTLTLKPGDPLRSFHYPRILPLPAAVAEGFQAGRSAG